MTHDWFSIGLAASAILVSLWSMSLTRKANRLRRQIDECSVFPSAPVEPVELDSLLGVPGPLMTPPRPDHSDGDENPCPACGHPAPEHYAWSTECARIDGQVAP